MIQAFKISNFAPAIFCCAIVALLTSSVLGQRPYEKKHHLIRGDMPPGLAAESYRLSRPEELSFHTQPVRIIVPHEARLEIGMDGAFVETYSSRATVGLSIGPVYRFKVNRIPQHHGRDLYPSLEILDKLSPPEGLENDFPIQVVITKEDLEEAIEGRMVTKVVYLEDPRAALPHRHTEEHQPYFDVGGGEDPLRAAERLGRPMAILRIGSRIPTHDEEDAGFSFYSPTPIMLGESQPVDRPHNWDAIEEVTPLRIPGQVVPNDYNPNEYKPNRVVPVVPGEVMNPNHLSRPLQNEPMQTDTNHLQPEKHLPPIVPGAIQTTNPFGLGEGGR